MWKRSCLVWLQPVQKSQKSHPLPQRKRVLCYVTNELFVMLPLITSSTIIQSSLTDDICYFTRTEAPNCMKKHKTKRCSHSNSLCFEIEYVHFIHLYHCIVCNPEYFSVCTPVLIYPLS